MVATILRWKIAIELIGAFVVALFFGAGITYTALLTAVILFVLHAAAMLITFAIAWPGARKARRSRRGSFFARLGTIAGECLAYFALFAVIQPFDRLFMKKDSFERPMPNELPVLLVHGYFCNRGLWWRLISRLRAQRLAVRAISLEPPFASIDALAGQLHLHIESYGKDTESEKLILVTHSMGGLVARAYLKRYGAARVAKLITLACPHHGTRIASLGLGRNAREMELGSPWLAALAEDEALPMPFINVWSTEDNFVTPQTSSRIEGSREIVLGGVGHLSAVFSGRILAILLKELR